MKQAETTEAHAAITTTLETEEPGSALSDPTGESVGRILSLVQGPIATSLPTLTLAAVDHIDGARAVVRLGAGQISARIDASVHPAVIAGAHARGERVLVEVAADGQVVVVGALRTRPTPGIDVAEEYSIEAARVSIEATEEISLSTRTASVVLRALGEVETYADRILSRAESVHKIVGRMLRLN